MSMVRRGRSSGVVGMPRDRGKQCHLRPVRQGDIQHSYNVAEVGEE